MRVKLVVLFVTLLLIAGGGFYAFRSVKRPPYVQKLLSLVGEGKYNKKGASARPLLQNNILNRLKLLEIGDSSVSIRALPHDSAVQMRASIPRGKPIEWIMWNLSSAIEGTSYQVDDCFCSSDERECKIQFLSSSPQEPRVILTIVWSSRYFSKTAKIAILIKNFGFAADKTTVEYLSFPDPLTVSLAPTRKLASWTAQISNEYKKEIVVLLPMEPLSRRADNVRPFLIMIHYPEAKLRSLIGSAVESVPNSVGFTNLSGVRVLEDSRVMDILFSEIKKRHGYFIEDGGSRKTVAPTFARKYSTPFAAIDCTVDTSLKVPQIQELLRRTAQEALKRGQIVISSKATETFIRALKSELPALRRDGIRLVYVSEIFAPVK
jgi:uncharacterized protein